MNIDKKKIVGAVKNEAREMGEVLLDEAEKMAEKKTSGLIRRFFSFLGKKLKITKE